MPLARLESQWTLVEGVRMHARVSQHADPAGPTVVLVHGLGVSSRYMVPTARRLAEHCHVFAPDMPGFGRSGKPKHVLSVPEMADYLRAWMDANRLHDAVLVGNSLGCQVIVDLIVRFPEYASRVVLQGPSVDPEARNWHQHLWRAFLDAWGEAPSLWGIILYDYLVAGLWRDIRTFQYALEDPIAEKLPRVPHPALVVRGTRDPIVPERWAEQAAKLLPQGRLLNIPGGTHALNYSLPERFSRVVCAFMQLDQ